MPYANITTFIASKMPTIRRRDRRQLTIICSPIELSYRVTTTILPGLAIYYAIAGSRNSRTPNDYRAAISRLPLPLIAMPRR